MDFLSAFLSYIFNKDIRVSSKAFAFLGILLLVLLLDNIFGFTHYYNTNRKLEVIREISIINKDTTLAPEVKKELLKLQSSTLSRRSIKDRVYNFRYPYSSKRATIDNSKEPESIKNKGSYLLHYLTSNLAFYFFFIYMLVYAIRSERIDKKLQKAKGEDADKNEPEDWGSNALAVIVVGWLIFWVTFITAWLFGLIPQILGNYYYNYSLQAIVNIGLVISVIKERKRHLRRKERIQEWRKSRQTTTNAQSST